MSIASKLLLLTVVGGLLLLGGGVYETLLQQPVSAEVAVHQLDNSEVAAAAARSYEGLRHLVPTLGCVAFCVFTVLLFRKELYFTPKR